MKPCIILLLLAGLISSFALGGTLTGVVRAEGKEGTGDADAAGKYDSRKFKFAERVDYAEMRDFVVYIEGFTGTNGFVSKPTQVVTSRKINQKGAMFNPHVLPVVKGAEVEWPNQDDIFHNVFSISDSKQFDLGLYKHPEVKKVTFDKTGRVDVFCSIHKAMNCVVLVLENPFFSATDERGRYTIANVPAGTYKLKAWHERLPGLVKEVTVPEQGEVRVDFVMGILNLPKY